VGHSHIPRIYECADESVEDITQTFSGKLVSGRRYLINAGSIGQPRDGNPNPFFVIYDSAVQTVEYRRFTYECSGTQYKILKNGLPAINAERLPLGR
jgi:diadenosine tetraphosphatase ApaH/serine/threonine PP2A family protein phosphatase